MYRKFEIQKNDVVSIVGSGGKTTLMFKLGRELKKMGKVLITTSTKIGIPTELEDDEICAENFDGDFNGINLVVTGGEFTDKKITSINYDCLKESLSKFDYVLIEADGSKQKPYKASRENEPVIYDMTTKTIAVLPMMKYLNELNEDDVFNFELFKDRFGNTVLDDSLILKMISCKEGIFKNSVGDKYLYLNRVEEDISKLEEEIGKLDIKLRR